MGNSLVFLVSSTQYKAAAHSMGGKTLILIFASLVVVNTQRISFADSKKSTSSSKDITVDTRAPSSYQNCNCQCDSVTWTDGQYIRGNCRSKDRNGALFCYVSGSALCACRDVQVSSFLKGNDGRFKYYSYEACTTPERNQCRNYGIGNFGDGDFTYCANHGGSSFGGSSSYRPGGSSQSSGGFGGSYRPGSSSQSGGFGGYRPGSNNGGFGGSSQYRPSNHNQNNHNRPNYGGSRPNNGFGGSLGSILGGNIRTGNKDQSSSSDASRPSSGGAINFNA